MIRICNSLTANGHTVLLIGVQFANAVALEKKNYSQKRLKVFFKNGFAFYAEYNVKLFFYLLFQKTDALCCIDLDTMLPVYFISVLKRKIRIYDAHEYFSQQKEIIRRPKIFRFWLFIEKTFVPRFPFGYTVSNGIAHKFSKIYLVKYQTIRNLPLRKELQVIPHKDQFILYQGSVNEGRGFEYLIPAMKNVNAVLYVYGNGNFLERAKLLVIENQLQNKIVFKGKFLPHELNKITEMARIGINLVEPVGQNQFLSLANKFFDYIQNEVPQITMNFPEYKKINDEYEVALLLNDLSVTWIEAALNKQLKNDSFYFRLKENCRHARDVLNWQNEERKLIDFYNQFKRSH
jgi:hypothetical protein